MSRENLLKKNKFATARLKISLVTRIPANKSIIFFWPYDVTKDDLKDELFHDGGRYHIVIITVQEFQ